MKISDVYVHDAQLYRVIEDVEACTLTMVVDLPILECDEQQEPRLLVFDDAYNYQVHEQPWEGLVTILDMQIVGKHARWHHVRIETNAGYRELFCTGVKVLDPSHGSEQIAAPVLPPPGSSSSAPVNGTQDSLPAPDSTGRRWEMRFEIVCAVVLTVQRVDPQHEGARYRGILATGGCDGGPGIGGGPISVSENDERTCRACTFRTIKGHPSENCRAD